MKSLEKLVNGSFISPFLGLKWNKLAMDGVRTHFQDFSRTQIDFSRALKFTLSPTIPRSQC